MTTIERAGLMFGQLCKWIGVGVIGFIILMGLGGIFDMINQNSGALQTKWNSMVSGLLVAEEHDDCERSPMVFNVEQQTDGSYQLIEVMK